MDGHRSLLERYVELYNTRDLDGCAALFVENARQVSPDGTVEGRTKVRDRLARQLAACPDMRLRVDSFVEQGDSFADEWAFAGTHTGPFLLPDGTELPPSGKPVEIRGMELVRLCDGQIVERHLYYDYLAVAAQFGLLPRTATTS